MIPFTRRELIRAWSCARIASQAVPRTDAHRLLLFYAVECGLKATYLRQVNAEVIDELLGKQHLHDLNSLMTQLRMPKEYFLPESLELQPIRRSDGSQQVRNAAVGALNQIWRYGGALGDASNALLEEKLEKICNWIAKEIR
jgi:hypothetical protein